MPCACSGSSKNGVTTWVYTAQDGSTIEYRTEMEARAQVIRRGGGEVQPA